MSVISTTDAKGVLVVAPRGDIDLTNANELRAAVLSALPNDRDAVIVDLSETSYLDSAGIRVLFAVARRLEERRRRIAVVAPRDAPVRKVLSIVGIESRMALCETVDAAREELRGDGDSGHA